MAPITEYPLTPTSLTVIIVSMGRLPLLKQSLATLYGAKFTGRAIIIEQGARDSGAREWLLAQPVDSLFLNKNHGKPYAWNVGLKLAGEPCGFVEYKTPSHVLLCDDDLVFLPGWQEQMLAVLERFYPQGLRSLSGYRHKSSANRKILEEGGLKVVAEVPYHPGCCILTTYSDALLYYGSCDTNKAIGFVEGPPQKKINRAGYWCGSVVESCIEHMGEPFRTYKQAPGGGLAPQDSIINMADRP